MKINQDEIDAIKKGVDLVPFMKACGIELKQVGGNYRGHCPFHEDTTPSLTVNPKENLWNCFGCDKGGDNIRFVQLFDKISFAEAVERLKGYFPGGNLPKNGNKNNAIKNLDPARRGESQIKQKQVQPVSVRTEDGLTVQAKKLLARVVDHYQHSFGGNPKGLHYLQQRNITDIKAIKDFGAGFVDGSLKNLLPRDEKTIAELKALGLLNGKGNEVFYNCVVFPLHDREGVVVNLYGRNISGRHGTTHLYLAGSSEGLVNRQAIRRSETIILTESIIDGLTLYSQGFRNVVPVYGVNGPSKDHLFLFNGKTKEIFLAFDNDQAGIDGMARVGRQLEELGIASYPVTLPVKDCNLFFEDHGPEEFEQLLREARPEKAVTGESRRQSMYRAEERGFRVGYGHRQYQIKGIQKGGTQLKATIKAASDLTNSSKEFELTTIDLYSSRSRTWFAKLCAGLFNEPEALIKQDIVKLMTLVEEYQPSEEKEEEKAIITPQDKKLALGLLENPEMFQEILDDFTAMGVSGEETNKLVGYLAATSRKLADPFSVLIQSRSAAGKSTLQDAILSLIPEEEYEKYTRMSDQALFYKGEESLMHKVLAIEEAEGMGGAAYAIRNIQSAGQISLAVTGKDPATGKMETHEYKVKGPVCVMITTTATDIDQETASRFIFLTIDESMAMTEAIHRMQREAETLEGLIRDKKQERIFAKHHTAQRLLQPLGVVNPFARYLSYPAHSLRARRDHKKYLGLIRAIAFIHQFQRKKKSVGVDGESVEYIEVTLDDIDKANQLADEVLGQTMDELAQPSRTLLSLVFKMVGELAGEQNKPLDGICFTRRMIRERTGWSDWQVKTHIQQLCELEYLAVRMGSKGKEYSYILNYLCQPEEAGKCFLNLTTVEQIKKQMAKEKV